MEHTYKLTRDNIIQVAKWCDGRIVQPMSTYPAISLMARAGGEEFRVTAEIGEVIEKLDDGFTVWTQYGGQAVAKRPIDAEGNPPMKKDVDRPMEARPEMLVAQRFDAQRDARELVQHLFYPGTSLDDIYVVWFCKTLQNWKAMVSTNVADDCYYEVTHNGSEVETYVDRYVKECNVKAQYHEDGKIDFEWNWAVH